MHESIFRENDIRGKYPEELNELVIKDIAMGIAKKCRAEGVSSIAVARDGRLSVILFFLVFVKLLLAMD